MHPMLMEPREARPEIGPAAALDRDAVRQFPGGIPGRVLQHRVDLKDIDAVRLQFGGDLADLGPEQGQRFARQRAEVSMMMAMVSMPSECIEGR